MLTEKRKTFLINFAYFGVILLLAFVALRYALPLITPFALAFVIAYLLRRPIRFLEHRLHLPSRLSAILAVVLFYAAAGALAALLSIKAASGVITLVNRLPVLYETYALPFFTEVLYNVEAPLLDMDPSIVAALDTLGTQVIQSLGSMIQNLSVKVMGFATGIASAIPSLFIQLVLLVISTFFIAVDYDRLTGFCLRQMSDSARAIFLQIKEYTVGTLWVCIRSYALIMFITFVELSIGFSIIRIRPAVLIAALISLFDILPVLGTGGIVIPWIVLSALQGNYSLTLGLLIIYVTITVIRNIIEPKIVGSQLGLHPVVTLCSMFVGVQLLGVIGLFGFPIGLSLLCYLNDHGVIKAFR